MARTAQHAEAAARDWWQQAGRGLSPDGYAGRAALIVATNALAEAVATLLSEQGIIAALDRVRHDPVAGSAEVVTLTLDWGDQRVVIPVLPSERTWRVYREPDGDEPLGEPVSTATVSEDKVEPNGWVPARAITEQLLQLLR
ncbi:hypothetical protein GCM10012275_46650 [Longimycelium tulufanense]|uniref:Uncharacterized protein n=1 Tax=Longimycelium tulufanense TaxID=907463 RepID=A0A8J3CFC3_9PSEU|nr:hypothetical protein [Longimycelium tulufanense]GGM70879.1 hypothetical protein GCM10012275_46650 [Longimycelium tulufanense]